MCAEHYQNCSHNHATGVIVLESRSLILLRVSCICQSLPRSGRASNPQHEGQGHGLGCSARPHQTVGSFETWCCSQGRCSSPRSQTQKGAHLSRADWTTRSGQSSGLGWRGRGSDETRSFLCQLTSAKARSEPSILKGRAEQAWRLRWASTLACSAARAFAASLLNLRVGRGADGNVPRTHEVVHEFRHGGLR